MWFPPPPYFPQYSCRQSGEEGGRHKVAWKLSEVMEFVSSDISKIQWIKAQPAGCTARVPEAKIILWNEKECRKQAQKRYNCRRMHPTVTESSSTCFLLKKAQEIWLPCTSTLIVRKYHVLTSFYSSQKRQNKIQWLEIKSQTTLHKKYDIHLLSNAD